MPHVFQLRWILRSSLGWLLVALAFGIVALGDAPDAQAHAQKRSQFFPTIPLWTHHVEIKVPFRDVNGDGRNDYNPQFNLRSERIAGPDPDDTLEWCPGPPSPSPTLTFRPRVGESGSEVLATYSASLLHQECQLSTTFPSFIASGVGSLRLQRSGASSPITNRHNDTVRVTYIDSRTTFRPSISITGFTPADEGTVIRLRFTHNRNVRNDDLCALHESERISSWRVDADGRAVSQQRATLIHSPAAATVRERNHECSYHASWPSVRGFRNPAGQATRPHIIVRPSSSHITGRYVATTSSEDTTFAPELNFMVPFVDYDNDGAHDYRGTQFGITYSRASGQPSGCSGRVSALYEVGAAARASDAADGARDVLSTVRQVDPVEPLRLVDTPHRTQNHCRYDVELPSTNLISSQSVEHFHRPAGSAAPKSISASGPEVQHLTYENSAISRTVTFAVTAPPEAGGQTFTATLADTSNTDGLCSTFTNSISLVAGVDGLATAQERLIDYWSGHASASDRCTYSLTWDDEQSETGGTRFTRVGPAEATIDSAVFDLPVERAVLSNSYGVPVYDATLEVATNVPVVNDTEFVVSLSRTADSDPACDARLDDESIVVLAGQTSAQAVIHDIAERPPAASPPAFCAYTVEWPPTVGGQIGWVLQPRMPNVEQSISAANQIARVTYHSVFDAVVEASTTVSVGTATTFTVPVNSADGCTDVDDVEITLEQDHSTGSTTLEELLAYDPADATPCFYEVMWPASETGTSPSLWTSDLSHDTTDQVGILRRRVTHRYVSPEASTFTPNISVHVPQIDGPTAGVNLFAGAEITLTFARAPQTHLSCSMGTPSRFTFTVQPDGDVTGDAPTDLVDIPARGSEPCVYMLDASAPSSTDATIRWALHVDSITSQVRVTGRRLNARTGNIEADAPHVLVDYRVGDVSFVPEIGIAVPQINEVVAGMSKNIYSDARLSDDTTGPLAFGVSFAAAPSTPRGCAAPPSGDYTFTVQPDGSVAGVPPLLDAYVVLEGEVGFGSNQMALPCSYDVTFPAMSSGQSWLTKATDETDDTLLSAASPSAAATYQGRAVEVDVDVRVQSPVVQSGSGRMVDLVVTASAGTNAGCVVGVDSNAGARTASLMVTLDATGETDATGRLRLVELPANASSESDRCTYDVAWSETDVPAETSAWVRTTHSQTWPSPAVDARLGTPSDVEATYEVPSPDDEFEASLVLLTSQSIPEDLTFTVRIAPSTGSPIGCTEQTTEEIAVAASTHSLERSSSVSFNLLRRVAGSVRRCVYDVTWPPDEDDAGMLFTPDAGYTPDLVLSEVEAQATNRYTTSAEDLLMTTLLSARLDERAAEPTTFSVRLVAPASPLNCSATRDAHVIVKPGATLGETELTLMRRPAGATSECVYDLTWESSERGGTAWALHASTPASQQVSHDSLNSDSRYTAEVTFFTPTLRLDVPPLDFDDDGRHDYTGAHFTVRFTSSDAACSTVTRGYDLGANGQVEPVAEVLLVDQHQVRRCSYSVEFPPASTGTATPLIRSDVAGASPTVTSLSGQDTASARYRETVTRFDATLYLGGVHSIVNEDPVNPIPAGTPFTVTVRPQSVGLVDAGCDADPASPEQSITITIEKSEVIERLPSTQLTSATLAGLIADTADGEHCVYEVDWPDSEDDGSLYRIYDNPSRPHSDTVRAGNADDVGAVVWYEANSDGVVPLASFFAASVQVELSAASSTDAVFSAYLNAPDAPAGCTSSRDITVTVLASEMSGAADIENLVLRPFNAATDCFYTLSWPEEDDAARYRRDDAFAEQTEVRDGGPDAAARYEQVTSTTTTTTPVAGGTTTTTVPVAGGATTTTTTPVAGGTTTTTEGQSNPGANTRPPATNTGGAGARRTTGRASGGGASAGRSTSSGATATWTLASTRLPVSVTLVTPPEAEFAVGSVIEVLVNSPGPCGDDLVGFDGLAAEIGVVYAVSAVAGAEIDVLAGADLRLPPYQQRGDQTRACDVRVTLISAPVGCRFEGELADESGRSYVMIDGADGDDFTGFAFSQTVFCATAQGGGVRGSAYAQTP